jgi:hypothetical protein
MIWPWKRKTVVLGAEWAAARKAEEARLTAGVIGPSPLPEEKYDFERGDFDLVAVTPLALDLELRAFTQEVRQMDLDEQCELQMRPAFNDLCTLIHFIKRCSVLALNENKMEWCLAGLTALSMIDLKRVDWRDAKWAAGLLEHAIMKNEDVQEKLTEAAVHLPGNAIDFLKHLPATSTLLDWGYDEINRGNGIGLIERSFAEYRPTVDLTGIALQISEKLTRGCYVGHVEIATEIPEIWFSKAEQQEVKLRLTKSRGVAAVRGSLRAVFGSNYDQMLVEWILEMPTADDCKYFSKAVGSGTPLRGRYAVGVPVDNLFALLVAGSIKEGVKPYENLSSLRELSKQTRQILGANTGSRFL